MKILVMLIVALFIVNCGVTDVESQDINIHVSIQGTITPVVFSYQDGGSYLATIPNGQRAKVTVTVPHCLYL